MMVISMYLSCIMDVLKVVPHTSVFIHTVPITFLGPILSAHPDLGICNPWVWLLLGGGGYCMAVPDIIFGRQGMRVPAEHACPVGCCPVEPTACQASTWDPLVAPTLHAPGLTHWAAAGDQTGHTRQRTVPAKYINDVFSMYFNCICDVLTTHFVFIGHGSGPL